MIEKVLILPYNPNWPVWFQQLQTKLKDCLGNLAISIDHIGSTAVPGLGSKNKIDVQITVKEISENMQDSLNQALQSGGFQTAQFGTDHCPPNDMSSIDNWEKFYLSGENLSPLFSFNIHIRAVGKKNQKYALIFRDYLREHQPAAKAYQVFKETLAQYHPDNIRAYVEIKDPVCDIIMAAAWDWADDSTTG